MKFQRERYGNKNERKESINVYRDRLKKYQEIEERLETKLITYVTSDRKGFETQIGQDVIDLIHKPFRYNRSCSQDFIILIHKRGRYCCCMEHH